MADSSCEYQLEDIFPAVALIESDTVATPKKRKGDMADSSRECQIEDISPAVALIESDKVATVEERDPIGQFYRMMERK